MGGSTSPDDQVGLVDPAPPSPIDSEFITSSRAGHRAVQLPIGPAITFSKWRRTSSTGLLGMGASVEIFGSIAFCKPFEFCVWNQDAPSDFHNSYNLLPYKLIDLAQ